MKMQGQIIIYQKENGIAELEVSLRDNTVWLSQKQMADLFDTDRTVITKHIRNILTTNELQKKSVCAIFAHTAKSQNYKKDIE